MDTVLILGRGSRMAPTLGVMAETLSERMQVVVSLGLYGVADVSEDERAFSKVKGATLYDLTSSIEGKTSRISDLVIEARKIEREIGITMTGAGTNYFLYRRQAREMMGWDWDGYMGTEEDCLREFVGAYHLYKEIIERHNVTIGFCECPDTISAMVCLALFRQRGLFLMSIHISPIAGDGRIFLYHGANSRNVMMDFYLENVAEIPESCLEEGRKLVEQMDRNQVHDAVYLQSRRKAVRSPLKLPGVGSLLKYMLPSGWGAVLGAMRDRYSQHWYLSRAITSPPDAPFVLFLLQHQPEASTAMNAPKWVDQDAIVERLALAAPAGYKVLVKENPRCFGWRKPAYFERFSQMHNVELVDPSVPNVPFIEGCEAIVAITGSIGMEGILKAKKVGLLGNAYYSNYRHLRRLTDPAKIFELIEDESWNPSSYKRDRELMAAAYIASLHDLGLPGKTRGFAFPEPSEGGRNLARSLERFLSFVREHHLDSTNVDPGTQFAK